MTTPTAAQFLDAILRAASTAEFEAAVEAARLGVRSRETDAPATASTTDPTNRDGHGRFKVGNQSARRRKSRLLDRLLGRRPAETTTEDETPTTAPKTGKPSCGRDFGLWKPGSRGF